MLNEFKFIMNDDLSRFNIYLAFSQKIRSMLYLVPTKSQISYKIMDQLNDAFHYFENGFIDKQKQELIINDILTPSQTMACHQLQLLCKKIIGSLQELLKTLPQNANYKGITLPILKTEISILIKNCILFFMVIKFPINLSL